MIYTSYPFYSTVHIRKQFPSQHNMINHCIFFYTWQYCELANRLFGCVMDHNVCVMDHYVYLCMEALQLKAMRNKIKI